MVQEKVVSISTTLAPETGNGQPFLWEVVDGVVTAGGTSGGVTEGRAGGSSPRPGSTTRADTTVQVRNTSGGGSSSSINLPANQIYVDLFPNRDEINVFSTSGTLSNPTSLVHEAKEVLTFSNSDRASLRYGDIGNENITLIGSFLDVNGNTVSPSFNVDGGSFEVVSSIKGYGVIEITYTASKKRYLFEFVGSCPATIPLDEEGNEEDVFEQATLLATWLVDEELLDATVNVTNANSRCGQTGDGNVTIIYPDEEPIGFQLINIGTSGSLSQSTALGSVGTSAVTRIKVFPGGASDLEITVPEVDSFRLSNLPHQDEFKRDLLQFQNTFQQNTSLSIADGTSLNVAPVTDILDQFGNVVTLPKFAGPGEEVREVTWTSSTTFTSAGRTFNVPIGTVISVNSFNDTLPITGTCELSYTAPYDLIFLSRTIELDTSLDTKSQLPRNAAIAQHSTVSVRGVLNGQEIAGTISVPEHDAGENGRSN